MTESDWKAFRKIVPELRERYIQKRNAEIAAILQAPDQTETERFWNVHEKITKEAEILESCLDGHRRSRMVAFIYEMLAVGLMDREDLAIFSPEIRERATAWYDENIRTERSRELPSLRDFCHVCRKYMIAIPQILAAMIIVMERLDCRSRKTSARGHQPRQRSGSL
jgi:hypothetical protein